jgi:hypothetical protein
MIETTRGPSINWPGDYVRTFEPGLVRYYGVNDDGVEGEITEAEYRNALTSEQ